MRSRRYDSDAIGHTQNPDGGSPQGAIRGPALHNGDGVDRSPSVAVILIGVFTVPPLLTRAVLPSAELSAARLDGELFRIDESWICADEPDSPDLRARSLATLLPVSIASGRLVMMGLTAAWLHGATDEAPWRHEVCSRSDERAGIRLPPRFRLRELCVAVHDECLIGALRVTTPARTAFDLGRRKDPDERDLSALRALVHRYRIQPSDLTDRIGPLPGRQRSLELIAAVAAQPPLTR